MNKSVNWGDPNWGGNVHESSTGSWLEAETNGPKGEAS
jgi:hypothetical protein